MTISFEEQEAKRLNNHGEQLLNTDLMYRDLLIKSEQKHRKERLRDLEMPERHNTLMNELTDRERMQNPLFMRQNAPPLQSMSSMNDPNFNQIPPTTTEHFNAPRHTSNYRLQQPVFLNTMPYFKARSSPIEQLTMGDINQAANYVNWKSPATQNLVSEASYRSSVSNTQYSSPAMPQHMFLRNQHPGDQMEQPNALSNVHTMYMPSVINNNKYSLYKMLTPIPQPDNNDHFDLPYSKTALYALVQAINDETRDASNMLVRGYIDNNGIHVSRDTPVKRINEFEDTMKNVRQLLDKDTIANFLGKDTMRMIKGVNVLKPKDKKSLRKPQHMESASRRVFNHIREKSRFIRPLQSNLMLKIVPKISISGATSTDTVKSEKTFTKTNADQLIDYESKVNDASNVIEHEVEANGKDVIVLKKAVFVPSSIKNPSKETLAPILTNITDPTKSDEEISPFGNSTSGVDSSSSEISSSAKVDNNTNVYVRQQNKTNTEVSSNALLIQKLQQASDIINHLSSSIMKSNKTFFGSQKHTESQNLTRAVKRKKPFLLQKFNQSYVLVPWDKNTSGYTSLTASNLQHNDTHKIELKVPSKPLTSKTDKHSQNNSSTSVISYSKLKASLSEINSINPTKTGLSHSKNQVGFQSLPIKERNGTLKSQPDIDETKRNCMNKQIASKPYPINPATNKNLSSSETGTIHTFSVNSDKISHNVHNEVQHTIHYTSITENKEKIIEEHVASLLFPINTRNESHDQSIVGSTLYNITNLKTGAINKYAQDNKKNMKDTVKYPPQVAIQPCPVKLDNEIKQFTNKQISYQTYNYKPRKGPISNISHDVSAPVGKNQTSATFQHEELISHFLPPIDPERDHQFVIESNIQKSSVDATLIKASLDHPNYTKNIISESQVQINDTQSTGTENVGHHHPRENENVPVFFQKAQSFHLDVEDLDDDNFVVPEYEVQEPTHVHMKKESDSKVNSGDENVYLSNLRDVMDSLYDNFDSYDSLLQSSRHKPNEKSEDNVDTARHLQKETNQRPTTKKYSRVKEPVKEQKIIC